MENYSKSNRNGKFFLHYSREVTLNAVRFSANKYVWGLQTYVSASGLLVFPTINPQAFQMKIKKQLRNADTP